MSEYFPFSAETSKESDADKSPESSKSKKKKSFEIGKQTVPAIIEAPKFDKSPRQPDRIEELLGRRPLAEVSPEGKPDKKTPKAEKHEEEAGAEAPLEALSTAESHEAVKRYAQSQKEAIAAVTDKADAERRDEAETKAVQHAKAEDAADVALLDAVEEKLAADPDKSVAEALDEAEVEVSQRIEAAAKEAHEAADEEAADVELAGAENPEEGATPEEGPEGTPSEGVPEGEVPLNAEEADEEIVLYPAAPAGSPPAGGTGSGSGTVPPRPGGPGFGPIAGGPAAPNFNAAPTPPQVIEVQDITAERRAMAQGVLVGSFVGYLVGRRRGRIKTEKRLLPVQRKLEKQVNQLYDTVAEREQSIRKLAHQKSETLAASKIAQQRFAERLAASRTEQVATTAEKVAVAERHEGTAVRSSRGEQLAAVQPNRSERFTAAILEAPAVVLAAAATLRAERRRDTEPAVDFTKKVEAYTPQELDRAAEKIKIDGTTLKELARAHSLDERAVRRVVGEFIEGGNVKEALTHEMVEKELQFERDPKLRQAHQSGQLSGGSAAVVGAAGRGSDRTAGPTGDSQDEAQSDAVINGKKPTPDQATIAKLRKQQITQISVAATIVILFAAIIVALLS